MNHYMNDLTIAYDATMEVWLAWDGPTQDSSTKLGEGRTPEGAALDFWWQINHRNPEVWVSSTLDPDDNEVWVVERVGNWDMEVFDTKDEAINWAINKGFNVTVED